MTFFGPDMTVRFWLLLAAMFVAGCATQPYADTTILLERKAYAACVVTHAFLSTDTDTSEQALARSAILQCLHERQTVHAKLLAENADRPAAAEFADAYMTELDAAMLQHLAMRLAEERHRRAGDSKT